MSGIKWAQIVCLAILAALTPLMHLRNYKFNDPKNSGHHWFARAILICWFLVVLASGYITYLDASQAAAQQRAQWAWSTGGTNVPYLTCSAPYTDTNLLRIDLHANLLSPIY